MHKINTNELTELTWSSPKGKFSGAGKEVSEALGRKPLSTDLNERHPFDVEILRIPPGQTPYPFHLHSSQWEFYHGRVTPGTEYERLSVATYATHDHKPMRALWEEAFEHPTSTSDQARSELEKIATFTGFTRTNDQIDFERDFYPAMMAALFESESWIAVVMITDLLARKYRFNIPGTAASSNWVRRMQRSVSQLRSSPKERKRMQLIRTLLEKSGRV